MLLQLLTTIFLILIRPYIRYSIDAQLLELECVQVNIKIQDVCALELKKKHMNL